MKGKKYLQDNGDSYISSCPKDTEYAARGSYDRGAYCDLHKDSSTRMILGEGEYIDFTWGEYYMIGTAAYWISQAKLLPKQLNLKAGKSLAEEVVFCLLGGYGITFEVNDAAYKMIKREGLFCVDSVPSEKQIEAILRQPMVITGRIKPTLYRFPVQKSKRIHDALLMLNLNEFPMQAASLRESLMKIPGIGFKTASWVVRNYLDSDQVAIIDIHVQRAGVAAGIFKRTWKLPKDYGLFEKAFLIYANMGGISASLLDICIWEQMRGLGRHARYLLPTKFHNNF